MLPRSSNHEPTVRGCLKTYPSQSLMGEGWACPERRRRDGGDHCLLCRVQLSCVLI